MPEKYVPRRDYRFEYIYDAVSFVEEYQCGTCRFRKNPDDEGQHAIEFPMCFEVEAAIMAEDGPVEALDDLGTSGVVCVKYRQGNPEDFVVDPDQLTLGET